MNPIQAAIDYIGNASLLARRLGVTPQAVFFWRDGARQIPADKCIAIDALTNGLVRCEALRPEVDWGYLRNTPELAPAPANREQPITEPAALG